MGSTNYTGTFIQVADDCPAEVAQTPPVGNVPTVAALRSSPLAKRYGWGIHHDTDSRVALVPLGSDEYRVLVTDPTVKQLKAMRSKRA